MRRASNAPAWGFRPGTGGAIALRATLLALIPGAAFSMPQPVQSHLLRADRSDVSAPLALLAAAPRGSDPEEEEHEMGPRPVPLQMDAAPPSRDPVAQLAVAPLISPQTGVNFDGIGLGFLGLNGRAFEVTGVPPDPQGDVGPSHYLQMVNSSLAIFAKDGRPLAGPMPTRTLFAGFGGACEERGDGDGIVLYDPLADRWLVSQLAIVRDSQRPYHMCLALSRSGDPTGQWARYDYSYVDFHDYPKFGVWPDGYYVTYNTFSDPEGGTFHGMAYCAFERTQMLAALPAAQQCIMIRDAVSGLSPADLDGTLPPPPGTPNTAVGFSSGGLALYRFHLDWSDPASSFLEPADLAVAPFAPACSTVHGGACIPQAGASAPLLDSMSDRMMFRAAYRNLGRYQALAVNHSVAAGSVTGVRWYEIRDPAGLPVLYQQGTYSPDESFRWMGSAAIDRAGNIGLGFSLSSAASRPAIGYTGHLASDAPGQMGQGEGIAVNSGGSQSSSLRWGDYSSMSVDPSDECTFWYTNEYIPADGAFNWRTRIFSFQLPGCSASAEHAVWPAGDRQVIGRGGSASLVLASAALRPSAAAKRLTLTVGDLPPGVSGRIDPAQIWPGEKATLTLTAARDAEPGRGQGYSIRATASDGTVAAAAGTLDVADSDFALEAERAEVSVATGDVVAVRISAKPLFGTAEMISLSAVPSRGGTTVRIEPQRIAAGSDATLTITGAGINTAVVVTAESPSTVKQLVVHARALDASHAEAQVVSVLVPSGGNCGCSASAGGWDSVGLLGLLAVLRRRRRITFSRRPSPRSPGAPPSSAWR